MKITLNGLSEQVSAGTTVDRLLEAKGLSARGIAIAVNDEIVGSTNWANTLLAGGDVIEIVTARQGG
ncbi:MAG: sulfur carrier protein ThiS [Kineosporiaceae bacterium]|nr:sulfur carrier protein ThiS [Aeromicrobium sp.]